MRRCIAPRPHECTFLTDIVSEYQPVDVSKLRPGSSYKSLIEKRTHPIDELVARFGRIPEELLTPRARARPAAATDGAPELEKDHMRDCPLRRRAIWCYVNPTFDEAHYSRCMRRQTYQDIVRDLGHQQP